MVSVLRFTDPDGRRHAAEAVVGRELPDLVAGPAVARWITLDGHWNLVQVRLPSIHASTAEAQRALETEVGTALAIRSALRGTGHEERFPVPVGYDMDAAEPFVLYLGPRGDALAEAGGVQIREQPLIQRDLVLAVRLLEGLGLVHRDITPARVHWDGGTVQLWGLAAVIRAGRPRTGYGLAPYASPEQLAGSGEADPRDSLWSIAQLMYHMVARRPGNPHGRPDDLARYPSLAPVLGPLFAPLAQDRPSPAQLLERLQPGTDPVGSALVGYDRLDPLRKEFDVAAARKRASRRALPRVAPEPPSTPGEKTAPQAVDCPYCLESMTYDASMLFLVDTQFQFQKLDVTTERNQTRLHDLLRRALQKCPGAPGSPPHYVPVPYLTNGRPLIVAMVGSSHTGKSHLLAQMIGEVAAGALGPFGLEWQSVSPQIHAAFYKDRVAPLRSGKELGHTQQTAFAEFAEAVLITDRRGRKRPVAFFDLGGEDLLKTNELLNFLLNVDALVFVVDPLLALPLPQLEEARNKDSIKVSPGGDPTFDTVLDRLPAQGQPVAAVVVGKSDLIRFESPVGQWLDEALHLPFDPGRTRDESRDVYAFLRLHAERSWLRPFESIPRCTLHFASATGGRAEDGRYPHGVRERRVIGPLLSVLAMCGFIDSTEEASAEVGT